MLENRSQSVTLVEPPSVPEAPRDRLYRMPLEVYEGICRAALLGAEDQVELLDGLLVSKMSKNPPHSTATYLVWQALSRITPAGWHVKKEEPVRLPTGPSGHASVPEPDLTVIRGRARDYADRHPLPADIALVVEVSDSTLVEDRAKLSRYAWENLPVAWVVDLTARRVEVYSSPSGPADSPGYREVACFGPLEEIPVVLDGREVGRLPAAELLP